MRVGVGEPRKVEGEEQNDFYCPAGEVAGQGRHYVMH